MASDPVDVLIRNAKPADAQAVVDIYNPCIAESVAIHEKFGMRKVAHFVEVGYKFGRWLDVGYWQVNLEA